MTWKLKSFNELELHELYSMLTLRSDVFVVEQNCVYQDCDGKDQLSYHLFYEVDGEILACCRLLPKGVSYKQASIGRVVVHPEHRGSGVARAMMKQAIAFILNELNESEIKIQAQSYLQNFYGSLGFVPVSNEYLEDGIPHIDMMYNK